MTANHRIRFIESVVRTFRQKCNNKVDTEEYVKPLRDVTILQKVENKLSLKYSQYV